MNTDDIHERDKNVQGGPLVVGDAFLTKNGNF